MKRNKSRKHIIFGQYVFYFIFYVLIRGKSLIFLHPWPLLMLGDVYVSK
ncbi:hypothetical protein SAMN04488156_101977 [Bacillus sp. 166amftsu]|nr:hypothetical protein SAMN04488156_101977 [Bacillus sp. 166amftsu]